jgi:hypothetical protein
MRSLYAGDALDPPLWIVPNKAFSLSLSLSHSLCLGQCIEVIDSEPLLEERVMSQLTMEKNSRNLIGCNPQVTFDGKVRNLGL